MRRNLPVFTVTALAIIAFAFTVWAIDIDPDPNPAKVGERVRIDVLVSHPNTLSNCGVNIDFGDGTPSQGLGFCGPYSICPFTTYHRYQTEGTRTITVTGVGLQAGPCFTDGDNPATRSITIGLGTLPLQALPAGTVGLQYEQQLRIEGCRNARSFTLDKESRRCEKKNDYLCIPPGLKLDSRGRLRGTPTRQGMYQFVVNARCSGGKTVTQPYSVTINFSTLKATADPARAQFPGGRGSQSVTYYLKASSPVNVDAVSTYGEFFAAGGASQTAALRINQGFASVGNGDMDRPLGRIAKRLTAQLKDGSGDVSEIVRVPAAVLTQAKRLGVSRLWYRRTFTSTATTPVAVNVNVDLTSAATAAFTITRMRIYFEENNRPKITFKRNQVEGRAVNVDVRYVGSGKLVGRWEHMDASQTALPETAGLPTQWRVLKRVIKNLTYGRSDGTSSVTFTLDPRMIKTQLPTHTPGTHRVRFVVEEPIQGIDFPQALYFVTAERDPVRYAIRLTEPANRAVDLPFKPLAFLWEGSENIVNYRIDIIDDDPDNPVFSAFTREPRYQIPAVLLEKNLSPGAGYTWKVSGFDKDDVLVGISEEISFTFQ